MPACRVDGGCILDALDSPEQVRINRDLLRGIVCEHQIRRRAYPVHSIGWRGFLR